MTSRRSALKKIGLGLGACLTSPLGILVNSTFSGFIRQAIAQESGLNPRKFVFINFRGAPSRWMYDQFLKVNESDPFHYNPLIVSNFSSTSDSFYHESEYKTFDYKGYEVPYLWSLSVKDSAGANHKVSSILDNFLSIRGIDTLSVAHPAAQNSHLRLPGNQRSLSGEVCDHHDHVLPAISLSGDSALDLGHNSLKGKNLLTLQTNGVQENVLMKIFYPFIKGGGFSSLSSINELSSDLDKVLQERVLKIAPGLRYNKESAKTLFNRSFTNLASQWQTLIFKYSKVISNALGAEYLGINDKSVGINYSQRTDGFYSFARNMQNTEIEDVRNLISGNNSVEATKGRVINSLAEGFATAEYLLVNNYSSYINITSGGLVVNNSSGANFSYANDQHFAGPIAFTLINNLYFLGFSAALIEFRKALIENNIFNDTVIGFGGEFNRTARNIPTTGGVWTGHGSTAQSISLVSGSIKGLNIVGSLTSGKSSEDGGVGTTGIGAKINALGGHRATNGHLHSSIAEVLKVNAPSTNNPSLLKHKPDGTIQSLIGTPRIVEDGEVA